LRGHSLLFGLFRRRRRHPASRFQRFRVRRNLVSLRGRAESCVAWQSCGGCRFWADRREGLSGHDTAEALADAGFIVAAINHPGDTANDSSRRNTLSVWASRPADMVRMLDFMLNDWKDREAIDPARIGFFGFSLGGYTGLVLVGGNPDTQRVAERCTEKTGICEELHNGATLPNLPHDARIKAAVLADAAITTAFTQESLTGIQVPLQIWRSELGGYGVDAAGTARVSGILPGKPEIHVVPAGHYAFLAPCSEQLATAVPRICTDDPPNFDRAAFHRDFNVRVVGFFRDHLVNDGGIR